MGLCYAHLANTEAAVKHWTALAENDQMVAPALGAMGNCYAQLGQLDKAAFNLLKAATKPTTTPLSPILQGQSWRNPGKNKENMTMQSGVHQDQGINTSRSYQAKWISIGI